MDGNRSWKSDLVYLGLLTGLCLAIGIHLIRGTVLISRDGAFYLSQAQRLAPDSASVVERYPAGYPFLLWAAHRAASLFAEQDSVMLWIHSGQGVTLLCRVLALVPLYFLGKLLVGATNSFWALLVLIVLPYPAHYGSHVLREWPYLLFLSLGFWLLCRGLGRRESSCRGRGDPRCDASRLATLPALETRVGSPRQWWLFALVGLVAGLGSLIRPECSQLVLYGFLGLAAAAARSECGLRSAECGFEPDVHLNPRSVTNRKSGLVQGPALPDNKDGWQRQAQSSELADGFAPGPSARPAQSLRPCRCHPPQSAIRNPQSVTNRKWTFCGAGLLLLAGFLVPVVPYVFATGGIVPHQLRPSTFNTPPVVSAVGSQAASDGPLEFEVAEGELLELPIQAADLDGDPLTFALVGVPVGSKPVYEFRSPSMGGRFWTADEYEKHLVLSTYSPEVWDYQGIAYYAYGGAEARTGLRGVSRFWSGDRLRHFYTMDEREKEAMLQGPARQEWALDGVIFYAFAEESRPPDTVAVRVEEGEKVRREEGRSGPGSSSAARWYAHPAGPPPAGTTLEGGVLRWRPGPGQTGEYQVNIIVSDGKLQTCQSVKITVGPGPGAAGAREERSVERGTVARLGPPISRSASFANREIGVPVLGSTKGASQPPDDPTAASHVPQAPPLPAQRAGLEGLSQGVVKLLASVAEDFMVFFMVPWLLGLYGRLRDHAGRLERVLVLAVVVVNVALILGRHVGFGVGEDRRYSLGLIALTIFYVPVGLWFMNEWLRSRPWPLVPRLPWFHIFLVAGIVTCGPKLLMVNPAEKTGYRAAAEWLRQNTDVEAVLAVPDSRISFYAERRGLAYERYPDWRRADHVVVLSREGGAQPPEGWRQEYAVAVSRKSSAILTIYTATQRNP